MPYNLTVCTFFLDLASHEGFLACVSDGRIIVSDAIDHRIDDAELVGRVENILKEAGWSYKDLMHLACIVGPGGFMSLRIAVAFINTLSHELNIPSTGIHLSDLYRARARARNSDPNPDFLWLHSTKKTELFIRGFGESAKKFPKPVCITVEELRRGVVRQNEAGWTGELIPEHREFVEQAGVKKRKLRPLEEILPTFLSSRTYEKKNLSPWYGRRW